MKKTLSWTITLFCLIALSCFFILSWLNVPSSHNDYSTFYHSLRGHHEIYKKFQTPASALVAGNMINFNTPLMNMILKSLVNISDQLQINMLAWTMVSFLGIGISIFCMCDYVGASYYYILPSSLLYFLTWANINTVFIGQVSNFILPFLCIAFLLGYYKQWKWMTVTLALLASLKLFFLVFVIFYIARKNWVELARFILLFLIFSMLPIFYYSFSDYHDFLIFSLKPLSIFSRSTNLENGSLLGFVTKIITFHAKPGTIINIQPIRYIIIGISSYILLRWIFYYRNVIAQLSKMEYEIGFCFMVILGLLLSPLAWIYYYVFLLIPAAVVLKMSLQYKLNHTFLLFFVSALFFYYLVGANNKILSHFSPFIDLVLWLICLVLMINMLQTPKNTASSSHKIIYGFFIINAMTTSLLLIFNFGHTNFL